MEQNHSVEQMRTLLEETLKDELLALYLFPTTGDHYLLPSSVDQRLLIVVSEEADIHNVRERFFPLWQEVEGQLVQPPLLAREKAFRRHLDLSPLFSEHLKQTALCLSGSPLSFPDKSMAPERRAAYLAYRAMRASTALAADLLPSQLVVPAQHHLDQLTVALDLDPDSSLSDEERFLRIQETLQKQIDTLQITGVQARPVEQPPVPSPFGVGVSAVYEETDRLVVIFRQIRFDLLRDLNWDRVGQRLQEIGGTLHLTTEAQLLLLLRYETPLDVALYRYHHVWGEDLLVSLKAGVPHLLRQAGQTASQLLIDNTIGRYLIGSDDEALHKVIHDYQNRLLNLRLQHDLLQRIHNLPAAHPPVLPDRYQPLAVRVDGILEQLDWWTEHYVQALQAEKNVAP